MPKGTNRELMKKTNKLTREANREAKAIHKSVNASFKQTAGVSPKRAIKYLNKSKKAK